MVVALRLPQPYQTKFGSCKTVSRLDYDIVGGAQDAETSASQSEGRWSAVGWRGWDAAAAVISAVGGLRKPAATSEAPQPTAARSAQPLHEAPEHMNTPASLTDS
jgi:hypothetical protein